MSQGLSLIPDARVAEAFQGLRVQVDLAGRERPIRTLLVVAPDDVEEKTSVAAYLGMVFAQAGRRVVLVSGDLHRPHLERIFGVERGPGLGEVAADELGFRAVVHRTRVPNLGVVPAGTVAAHPADVLASPAVGLMLREAAAAADLVVVEGPPVLGSAEASLLVPYCDAVLLVLEAGRTSRAEASAAKAALEKVRDGAVFLGVVLANTRDGRRARRRRRSFPGARERRARRGRRSQRGMKGERPALRSSGTGFGEPGEPEVEDLGAGTESPEGAPSGWGTEEGGRAAAARGPLVRGTEEGLRWEAMPVSMRPDADPGASAEGGGADVGDAMDPRNQGGLGDTWSFRKRSRLVGTWAFRGR